MPRSLIGEVCRVNFNLFWCNALLLLAAAGLGGIPYFLGLGYSSDSYSWLISTAPPGGLALWNLQKWLRRKGEPETHPFFEKIRSLGFGVPEIVDQDLLQAQDFLCLTLGHSWLLRRGFFKLELAALGDAVWAYKKEGHSEFFLLYTQAVVQLRSGKNLSSEFTSNTKKVEEFLSELSKTTPWIIMGENDDLWKLWKKERDAFVAQVDQRRKVLEAQKRTPPVP